MKFVRELQACNTAAIAAVDTTYGPFHGYTHDIAVGPLQGRRVASEPLVDAVRVPAVTTVLAEEEPLAEEHGVVVQLFLLLMGVWTGAGARAADTACIVSGITIRRAKLLLSDRTATASSPAAAAVIIGK